MRHLFLLLSALLFATFAQAASNANIASIDCSGSSSFDLTNGATLSCVGDFSLIGGSIDSDIGITISAAGSLFLDNLSLVAPLVRLTTLTGSLSLAEGVSINGFNSTGLDVGTSPRLTSGQTGDPTLLEGGEVTVSIGGDISPGQPGQITMGNGGGIVVRQPGDIDLSVGGQIVLNGGGDLTLVSSVPEPGMVWSLLCGGLLLASRRNCRKEPA
ncbi:MAG: hypothetical protein CVU33_12285 [Betaproteobacteria bacterium HGW-Betaproteobacteria-6]|jgi:hypothetical protein|nr:MAG: hypothetical protein CVU33_12285 [Betaproteobacteria bacterium HGW-Betaproteobacteria-6]